MGLPELDVLNELKELTPAELFGEWLPELIAAFTPFIEPAFAWLLEGLEVVISLKLDELEKTFKMSESGLEIEEGLREDALVTMFMSEEDFLSFIRGDRSMAIMPPSNELVDITEFPEMVKEYIEALKGIEAVLTAKIEDPEIGDLVATVKFAGPMKEEPDTEVTVPLDVLEGMGAGAYNPASVFILDGLIQVEGDVDLLMKLAMMMM